MATGGGMMNELRIKKLEKVVSVVDNAKYILPKIIKAYLIEGTEDYQYTISGEEGFIKSVEELNKRLKPYEDHNVTFLYRGYFPPMKELEI